MTVEELIEKLKSFPPQSRVVTPGFDESDYDDIATVEPIRLAIAPAGSLSNHSGRHYEAEEFERLHGADTPEYNKPRFEVDEATIEECVLINF